MDTCYIIAVAGGRPVVGFVRLFTTEMNFPKIPSNYYGLNAKENKSLGYSGMNFECIGVKICHVFMLDAVQSPFIEA